MSACVVLRCMCVWEYQSSVSPLLAAYVFCVIVCGVWGLVEGFSWTVASMGESAFSLSFGFHCLWKKCIWGGGFSLGKHKGQVMLGAFTLPTSLATTHTHTRVLFLTSRTCASTGRHDETSEERKTHCSSQLGAIVTFGECTACVKPAKISDSSELVSKTVQLMVQWKCMHKGGWVSKRLRGRA